MPILEVYAVRTYIAQHVVHCTMRGGQGGRCGYVGVTEGDLRWPWGWIRGGGGLRGSHKKGYTPIVLGVKLRRGAGAGEGMPM